MASGQETQNAGTAKQAEGTGLPKFKPDDHKGIMLFALEQARNSPPSAEKFSVGAALVDGDTGQVLSTGYSLEYPRDYKGDLGTTHAEQCCLIKISDHFDLPQEKLTQVLPSNTAIYTTMEPCSDRLSGKMACTARILRLKDAIKTVYIGIDEPPVFIQNNNGQKQLADAGVKVVHVDGLKDEIMKVAMAGHPGYPTSHR